MLEEIAKIESTKKHWEPLRFTYPPRVEAHLVVKRCLNLRHLEIDVQEWTVNTLAAQYLTGEKLEAVLNGHAKDEDNHAIVLDHLADYWSVEEDPEADEIVKLWQSLEGNLLAKKTFLEAGVFFCLLPLLIQYSDNDVYTSRVCRWILIDEQRHVAVSRIILKEYGIKLKKSYWEAVKTTLSWILKGEPQETIDQWINRAEKIVLTGKCEEFAEYSTQVVPGHFDMKSRKENANGYAY